MARKGVQDNHMGAVERQTAGTSWAPSEPHIRALLESAIITRCRPIMWGSNGTFLVTMEGENEAGESHAIYKPRRGESPLWDFPHGTLFKREMAAYLVSEALGWGLVPPTVTRDGPYGVGSMQLFIEHDTEEYFHSPVRRDARAAERIALLDVVLNNADRKNEHCLRALDGRTWAIDHGLTFHPEPKLRTVIWDFAGQAIHACLLEDLARLRIALQPDAALYTELCALVSEEEVAATRRRAKRLAQGGVFPDPGARRRVEPWAFW